MDDTKEFLLATVILKLKKLSKLRLKLHSLCSFASIITCNPCNASTVESVFSINGDVVAKRNRMDGDFIRFNLRLKAPGIITEEDIEEVNA
jgi:hypothetical protein